MNIADILIIALAALVAYFGHRRGLIKQFFSLVGIVAGFFVAAFLYDKLAFLTQDSALRAIVLAAVLLGATFLFFDLFMVAGNWLQRTWAKQFVGTLPDKIASGVVTGAGSIVVIWLLAIIFTSVLPQMARSQVEGSAILGFMTQNSTAPKLFTNVSQLLKPFGSPDVFVGSEPSYSGGSVNQTFANLDTATQAAKPSVVKITTWGCGSVGVASGFIVGPRHVVTNAHVVAGNDRISIQSGGSALVGRLVLFDPRLDFAILTTETDLPAPALTVSGTALNAGGIAALLGYPKGGDLMTEDSIVLEQLQADGYDIYRQEKVLRSVYALRADVQPGNSGGPLINSNGEVVGVIFGHSNTQSRVGYAFSSNQITSVIKNVATLQSTVSAGSCAAS